MEKFRVFSIDMVASASLELPFPSRPANKGFKRVQLARRRGNLRGFNPKVKHRHSPRESAPRGLLRAPSRIQLRLDLTWREHPLGYLSRGPRESAPRSAEEVRLPRAKRTIVAAFSSIAFKEPERFERPSPHWMTPTRHARAATLIVACFNLRSLLSAPDVVEKQPAPTALKKNHPNPAFHGKPILDYNSATH